MINLYQGSIFSCLTVTFPPPVPKIWDDLVHSNISVMTSSLFSRSYGSSDEFADSVLQLEVLPIFRRIMDKSPNFLELLNSFEPQLVFLHRLIIEQYIRLKIFNDTSANAEMSSQFSTFIKKNKTFAIMNLEIHQAPIIAILKGVGTHFIINNKLDTPFQQYALNWGSRNFFNPTIASGLSALACSGVFQRWQKKDLQRDELASMKQFSKKEYDEFARKQNSEAKEPISFHEAQQVSLKSIQYAFGLCGLLAVVGVLVFFMENWRCATKYFVKSDVVNFIQVP